MDWGGIGIFLSLFTTVWGVTVDVTHFVDIFRDDFDADGAPDRAKWAAVDKRSTVQGELQYYRKENVNVYNGYMHITTTNDTFRGYNFTSGQVNTQGLFDFQYGEIEWRAKVPSPKGIWPALWLLHYQCDPAVPCKKWQTVVKASRGDSGNQTVQEVTNWKYPKSKLPRQGTESRNNTAIMHADLSLDFHVYKMIWTSEELIWVIDDVTIFNVTGQDVPSTRMQLVMSVTVGGGVIPAPDTKFPTEFLIDYVVVRQPANVTGPARPPPAPAFVVMPLLVGLFGGILVVFLVIAAAYFFWRRRRALNKKKHPVSLQHATSLTALSNVYRRSSVYVNAVMQQDPSFQDYLKLLEVEPANLTITAHLLGKGQYGFVYKGIVKSLPTSSEEETPVAVKSLIEYDDAEQQRQFIEEMRIMKKVGRHLNIVNLIGLCRTEKILLIFEYCPNGSLLKFLRSRRRSFTDQVDAEGYLIAKRSSIPEEQAPETPTGYVRVVPGSDYLSTASVTSSVPEDALTTCDLINFAYQISHGLEYLALQSVIHRDIAARNILVADNYVVKIADFGMARRRLLTDYSMSSEQVALPIKWMAPESILHRTFSYKSDVWAFGVLLWEIFSLGDAPYSSTSGGSQFNGNIAQFVNALTNGVRMHRPPYSPVIMYEIMCKCWELKLENRPSIDMVRQDMARIISPASSEFYLKLEEPYINYNHTFRNMLSGAGAHAPLAAQNSTSSTSYQIMEKPL